MKNLERNDPAPANKKVQKKGKKRWQERPETADSLERAALRYLERYASTAANLRRVLGRRIVRARMRVGDVQEPMDEAIEAAVAKMVRIGLINDRSYAEAKAQSLYRGGASRRRIAATLSQKGAASEDIGHALEALNQIDPNAEVTAALRFAKRRRLGPYRKAVDRGARRDRDLAAMARAGFGLDLARNIVDAISIESLDELTD